MNKNISIGVVVAVVVIAGYFFFRSNEIITPPKNSTIVAFGDSLVQGVGAREGHDLVSLLSMEIKAPIVNEGRSGDTTVTALERIDTVLVHDPGIVIVLLGGNDYLRKIPKETTFQNLHTIISKFKENNTRVLLLGIRGGLLRDTYEKDFEDFAKREQVPFIPNVLDGLIGKDEYMSDQIHPNDRGYAKIAERVAPELKRMLGNLVIPQK